MPVCLLGRGDAEQIEGALLSAGGVGKDGGQAVAPEADEVARECGEVAEQGVEAVHREGFALGGLGAFAGVPCGAPPATTGSTECKNTRNVSPNLRFASGSANSLIPAGSAEKRSEKSFP